MSYLLDTHILLWARLEPGKLSTSHRNILSSNEQKFISTVSIWEISLKFSLGKLTLGGHNPVEFLDSALVLGFQIATPEPEQFASFHNLPKMITHKDPFDRMIIWQAIQGKFTLISRDHELPNYRIHGLQLS